MQAVEAFRTQILAVHAVLGVIIFITGLMQAILAKGGRIHVVSGKIYFWSWLGLLITGLLTTDSQFIVCMGLFGYYMCLTGYRFAHLKANLHSVWDKVFITFGALLCLVMIIGGGYLYLQDTSNTFAVLTPVFGATLGTLAFPDFIQFVMGKPIQALVTSKWNWYFEHFSRMYGSFIAATTAFFALNHVFTSETLNWTLPGTIGSLVIVATKYFYRKKFGISS